MENCTSTHHLSNHKQKKNICKTTHNDAFYIRCFAVKHQLNHTNTNKAMFRKTPFFSLLVIHTKRTQSPKPCPQTYHATSPICIADSARILLIYFLLQTNNATK